MTDMSVYPQHDKYYHLLQRVTGLEKEVIPLSTLLILQQADEHGVAWEAIPGTRLLKLTYNGTTKYFRYQISSETTDIGFYSCLDKGVSKPLLQAAGVSTPKGYKLEPTDPESYWEEVFHALQQPLVVKPSHGMQGKSIFMGISDLEKYKDAVRKAFTFSTEEGAGVIVEETFVGKEYRVLATREKVVGVIYRDPANVVGDGTSTIEQLIAQKNSDPRRGRDLNVALFIIDINDDLLNNIKEQGRTLQDIPKQGEKIYLRKVSNIAQGGDSIDMTDDIHPSVAEVALKAMNAIPGLGFAGVDFMTKDITAQQTPDSYAIIEINSSPGLCIHEYPYQGKRRYTDREFLYVMFPELKGSKNNA